MASAGEQIFNENGVLQLTDKYINIQLIDKRTYTLNANGGYTISDFEPKDHCVFAYRAETPGTRFRANLVFPIIPPYPPVKYGSPSISINGAPNSDVTVYRFQYADIPAGNFFEIRDSNGTIVFSDAAKFMKIIDQKIGTYPASWSAWIPVGQQVTIAATDHPTNIKTAVVIGNMSFQTMSGNYMAYQFFEFEADQVRAIWASTYWGPFTPNPYWTFARCSPYYDYMVIDVTDL